MKNNQLKLILPAIFLMIMVGIHAQNVRVTGIVSDAQSPLIGVNVHVKGGTTGVITDMNGKYSIEVPSNATLVFSYIGYADQEHKVGNRKVIDVTMSEDSKLLEEIVSYISFCEVIRHFLINVDICFCEIPVILSISNKPYPSMYISTASFRFWYKLLFFSGIASIGISCHCWRKLCRSCILYFLAATEYHLRFIVETIVTDIFKSNKSSVIEV